MLPLSSKKVWAGVLGQVTVDKFLGVGTGRVANSDWFRFSQFITYRFPHYVSNPSAAKLSVPCDSSDFSLLADMSLSCVREEAAEFWLKPSGPRETFRHRIVVYLQEFPLYREMAV